MKNEKRYIEALCEICQTPHQCRVNRNAQEVAGKRLRLRARMIVRQLHRVIDASQAVSPELNMLVRIPFDIRLFSQHIIAVLHRVFDSEFARRCRPC